MLKILNANDPARPLESINVDRLKELMINDNGFAFDPRTGFTYTISPTGLDILSCLKHGLDKDETVGCLLDEYDVDEETAVRDYERFVASLGKYSLLEIPPPS